MTSSDFDKYDDWVRVHDALDDQDRETICEKIRRMGRSPFFSLILISADQRNFCLADNSVISVERQLYPHWELWLPNVSKGVETEADRRLRMIAVHQQQEGATAFNSALSNAQGDFVLPLPSGAILTDTALYELAIAALECPEADLLYSDEDRVNPIGKRSAPHFKTGWDPDLALGRDALGLLVAYRKELLGALNGMRPQANNNVALSLYDLSLRAAFTIPPQNIHHIPAVLCHRRSDEECTLKWDAEPARGIVRDCLIGFGVHARVTPAPLAPHWNRIIRDLPDPAPVVSIIIPTRDHSELLERCAESVLSRTDYPRIELLIVDNDSRQPAAVKLLSDLSQDPRVRVLSYTNPFNFAAQNNMAAHQARGEILVLLNNDTEAVEPGWLREMVSHAVRPDVGAVGAKLLYPDNRVQHAGMTLGPGPWPQHQLRFADHKEVGLFGELALTRNVSVVTGACLAVRRAVFFEVNGFDEQLKVNFNDVDLCLRIGDCGYRIIWTPFAELLHKEAASRGPDDSPEKQAVAAQEAQYFWRRWQSLCENDPFHNPNLVYGWDTLKLSWPPRRKRPWSTCPPNRISDSLYPGRAHIVNRPNDVRVPSSVDQPAHVPAAVAAALVSEAELTRWEARAKEAERARAQVVRRIQDARRDVYDANLRAEEAAMRAKHAEAERDALLSERDALLSERDALLSERDALLSSSAWRATWPLRALGQYLPPSIRSVARAGVAVAWTSITLKLPGKLRERRMAQQLRCASLSTRPATAASIDCRKSPIVRAETCCLVTHSPDGHLRPHVRGLLNALIRENIGVILIVAADCGFVGDEPWLYDLVDGLFIRSNEGFDFAAWAHVMRLNPQFHWAKMLYLLNDSVIGPVSAASFHAAIERVRNAPGDVVGMTENYDRGWHIQSYFLALRQRALQSAAFRRFVRRISSLANKDETIKAYEVPLASAMAAAGLITYVTFKTEFRSDPTVYRWRELLEDGFPFIKIKTIRDEIPGVDKSGWRQALEALGFDVSIVDEVLAQNVPHS